MAGLIQRAGELEPEFIAIRREIHQNPETAFQEFKTTELIKKELEHCKIDISNNGDQTGVVGCLSGKYPGKVVALRADIDALKLTEMTGLPFSSRNSGVCHACGHDIHTAALLACARLLSERRNDLHGTVKFIFQPAEESEGGAKSIISNGFLENPKVGAVFGAHTWPEISGGHIGVRKGPMLAGSDQFRISVHAKGGHAAHPHKTADPIVVAAYIITQLQTIVSREIMPVEPAVITVGKMTAGTASNIIPSVAVLEGTVRTIHNDTRARIQESIERIATMTAQSLNASAQVEYWHKYDPTISVDAMVDLVIESATRLLGKEKIIELPTTSMGGEDFSYYLEKIPGAYFRLGTTDGHPESELSLHNSRLVFSEKAIMTGAITMCGIVFLYTDSDFTTLL